MAIERERILVVDDTRQHRELLKDLLEKEGYEVTAVSNGEDALIKIGSVVPDLILLDLKMPGIDGFEVCRRLKSIDETRDTPVIILTCTTETESVTKGFDAGAADYVTKPCNNKVLIARIRAHLALFTKTKRLMLFAERDALTNLANRRRFDEFLDLEWRRAKRGNSLIAMLLLDIDYFKAYNDTYGHLEGDRVLKEVAKEIRNACNRPGDLYARYGGEEFAVIFGNITKGSAEIIAERLRRKIEALRIPHKASNISDVLTVSIGVSSVVPSKEEPSTKLISLADKHLYEAKNRGRNRVS